MKKTTLLLAAVLASSVVACASGSGNDCSMEAARLYNECASTTCSAPIDGVAPTQAQIDACLATEQTACNFEVHTIKDVEIQKGVRMDICATPTVGIRDGRLF